MARKPAEQMLSIEETKRIVTELKHLRVKNKDIAEFCGVGEVQVSKWVNGHSPADRKLQDMLHATMTT